MIIIKSCEVIDVGDVTIKDIYRYQPWECLPVNDYSAVAEVSEIKELIRGRRFVRPSDGIDVYLGCTKEVQDLIGIQYEAWDMLQENYNQSVSNYTRLMTRAEELKREIREMKSLSFFGLIKWFITENFKL